MKKSAYLFTLMLLFSAGCGASNVSVPKRDEAETIQESKQEQNIIVELKQTTDDTNLRDTAYEKALENDMLTGGYLGENTLALQEDIGVQSIEAEAVFLAVNMVYGNLYDKGIMYLKNQTGGANESGIWIGIKEPDENTDELVRLLQKQVDEGKILAKYIHIFKTEYSEKDNRNLMYNVSKALKPMKEADRVSLSINVDTITRTIEIGHDFLTDKQIKDIKKQFAKYDIVIKQDGRMLPLPGEPDVEYPKKAVIREPSKAGAYVMSVSGEGMLIVSAKPADFSKTGGHGEYYGATNYTFPNANKKLKVGQRVLVEASGPIMESYPGQGRAKFVTVLPTYQPNGADLTEAEAVRQAIEKKQDDGGFTATISDVMFNEQNDQWTVTFTETFTFEDKVFNIKVDDQK
ncbi:DUF3221 domain-containing protein [Domibacillus mangrovi]|uniref:DUF3221 domain-containing protein n=1 Tax=Domibacillus mangrovi TaxID=1714354 RepID=A0A1Q5P398_9BACI|nr:DUF3221 domain-containing protein [Domibacillus mangrovi]OKL36668.1 hypothetical protein BLL40_07985 [Domibacillus mangrovi]